MLNFKNLFIPPGKVVNCALLLVVCMAANAQQTVSLSACSSAGMVGGVWAGNSVQYTIGETFIGAGQFGNTPVTIGFNQSEIQVTSVPALKQLENAGVKLFPNPVSNMLFVQVAEGSAATSMQLYNSTGQLVSSAMLGVGSNTLSCAGLPAGAYFLKLIAPQMVPVGTVPVVKSVN